MPPSEIRRAAREALRGKWGKGVCILLAYMVFIVCLTILQLFFVFNIPASFLLYVAITIISVPISLGLVISFMKLKRGETVTAFGFLKYGFNRFGKSWGIAWHTFIRMLIPIICMFLVMMSFSIITTISAKSSILNAASSAADKYSKALEQEQKALSQAYLSTYQLDSSYDSAYSIMPDTISAPKEVNTNSSFISSPLFTILFVVIYIATYVYVFSRSLLYVLAHNICYDNPGLSSKECVIKSAELMKGNRGNYFLLGLSFIGWFILAALPLYLGFFWLIPYMQVAMVCFYDRVIKTNSKTIDEEIKIEE